MRNIAQFWPLGSLLLLGAAGVGGTVAGTALGSDTPPGAYRNDYDNGYNDDDKNDYSSLWNPREYNHLWGTNAYAHAYGYAFTRRWNPGWASWSFTDHGNTEWVGKDAPSCAHPLTQTGVKLTSTCSPLVAKVCSYDSGCCDSNWDGQCVSEAYSEGTAQGLAPHPPNVDGGAGPNGRGVPIPSQANACAAAVAAADLWCAVNKWDRQCMDTAAALCTSRYLARPRVEADRVMVDVCTEPKLAGAPSCPLALDGSGECCREALVFRGVYRVNESPGSRHVQWASFLDVPSPYGWVRTRAMLVPNPCVTLTDGSQSCEKPHHLWQMAGPATPVNDAGKLYPECSVAGTPDLGLPCNGTNRWGDRELVDFTHSTSGDSMRAILAATQAALVTTNGSYEDLEAIGKWEALPGDSDDGVRTRGGFANVYVAR